MPTFTGTSGADTLTGGPDADTLTGGPGPDVLTGGGGGDTFVIELRSSPPVLGMMDTITDFGGSAFGGYDHLEFTNVLPNLGINAGNPLGGLSYNTSIAGDFANALFYANTRISLGAADIVTVIVGKDLYVFADSGNDNGTADDAVLLTGAATTFSISQIVQGPTSAPAPLTGASGTISGNMDTAHLTSLVGATVDNATDTILAISGSNVGLTLRGTDLTYANNQLVGGSATGVNFSVGGDSHFGADLGFPAIPAAQFGNWVATDATATAFATILAGSDTVGGSVSDDLIRGFSGNDILYGAGGSDTIYGGTGDDLIYAYLAPFVNAGTSKAGSSYLRGEDGNDSIVGGAGFDDINGNMGNDTITGGQGDDWLVGGQGSDLITADAGRGLLYGNLGNDTLIETGSGSEIIRGGQGDDSLSGGVGNDFVSGDKGSDTMMGGPGADTFHSAIGAGVDRVLDFQRSEGDYVLLDPGTSYAAAQVGSDTVVTLGAAGAGDQVILVGVSMASLTGDWIVVAV